MRGRLLFGSTAGIRVWEAKLHRCLVGESDSGRRYHKTQQQRGTSQAMSLEKPSMQPAVPLTGPVACARDLCQKTREKSPHRQGPLNGWLGLGPFADDACSSKTRNNPARMAPIPKAPRQTASPALRRRNGDSLSPGPNATQALITNKQAVTATPSQRVSGTYRDSERKGLNPAETKADAATYATQAGLKTPGWRVNQIGLEGTHSPLSHLQCLFVCDVMLSHHFALSPRGTCLGCASAPRWR